MSYDEIIMIIKNLRAAKVKGHCYAHGFEGIAHIISESIPKEVESFLRDIYLGRCS